MLKAVQDLPRYASMHHRKLKLLGHGVTTQAAVKRGSQVVSASYSVQDTVLRIASTEATHGSDYRAISVWPLANAFAQLDPPTTSSSERMEESETFSMVSHRLSRHSCTSDAFGSIRLQKGRT